jgi:putative addiction module killer protein
MLLCVQMPLTIVEYVREDGSNPYQAWFDDLAAQAAAKVATARARLEMGNTSAVKWIGVIGEYRIDWGPGYRIYLAKDGEDLVILLGGGIKRRQQADIQRAKILWTEYKARKSASRSRRR